MKRTYWAGAILALLLLLAVARVDSQSRRTQPVRMPEATSFRILFGVGDREAARWDGQVDLSGGAVRSIRGWRFAGDDNTDYKSQWKVSTRNDVQRGRKLVRILENGFLLDASLESEQAEFRVSTAQGNFSFRAQDVPYGVVRRELKGRVQIERVPPSLQLTASAEEQDHPAMARAGDEVYLAYIDFTHGDRSHAQDRQLKEAPSSFDFLRRPAGGDQVRLMRYSLSSRLWSPAEAVSAPGQDCMRAAVAVDGRKRVWVIWSARVKDNFDLYAKYLENGKWSREIRVTSDPGTDVDPVAAADSAGRVWVAWQGYRNGSLDILAAVQQGDAFTREQRVSFSAMSDWDAAIAAGPRGEVAVSWDTYDKGDYDVYVRRMRFNNGVRMDAPAAAAATPAFEARSSIAYDPRGRLWVAYETSPEKWGKDFGAYETTGVALYQGHTLKVKVFEGGKSFEPASDLNPALPGGVSDVRPRRALAQKAAAGSVFPNPELAARRLPSATPQPPPLPMNSFPRLAAGPDGMIYLAYRTSSGVRSPVGTIWNGQVVYFDGSQWKGPVNIPHSDGLLDVRASLLAPAPGQLLMVATTDHRQGGSRRGRDGGVDSINADLYAAEVKVAQPVEAARLKPQAEAAPAPASKEVSAELAQVKRMRDYRANPGGIALRLLRGEFHRHTEISGDGGRDGPIIDAYRYLIDAAYMDWGGCCDHDNGGGREYFWWINQKLTDAYNLPGRYLAMFSYERSVRYPEGHRNVVFAERGIRPLPRLPISAEDAKGPAPDTQMLYRYLRQFQGIAAVHTSGTNMGTDWRDNDPIVEPVVEIYQGDRQNYEMPDAPRSNNAKDSIGGWRPLGFVSNALQKGYRLGFQASSDHISTHMSYCNLWVTEPTRQGIMEAFRKRRVYGATDNILADVRCGEHFMGEEFEVREPPSISVKLWGSAAFAKVHIIKDDRYVYTTEPNTSTVDFNWRDASAEKGKTSYYYVRGEQADGELVWVSPMWITWR